MIVDRAVGGLDLRLLALPGRSHDTVALADVEPGALPVDAGAVISITHDGREHLGPTLTWGPWPRVAAQFEPAADRLASGQLAMIRSARLDISSGICLLAEPRRNSVILRLGAIGDLDWSSRFPDDSDDGDALYTYVAAHLDDIVAAADHLAMEPAHGARARLIDALRREAAIADAVRPG